MYHDRPCANPTPTHNKHPLHDGNGFSHSLHLGSNRTGKRKQSPHLYAACRRGRKRSSRPCYYLLLNFHFASRTSPPPRPRVAQQLSIKSVKSVSLSGSLIMIPAGLGDHKNKDRQSLSELELSLTTAVDGTPRYPPIQQVTGLAGAPAFADLHSDIAQVLLHPYVDLLLHCGPSLSPARCLCGCADCRTMCCGWLWPAVPLLRLTFCISRLPIMLSVSEGLPS